MGAQQIVEVRELMAKRGIDEPTAAHRFRLGLANRTLIQEQLARRVARTNLFVREGGPPTNKFVGATRRCQRSRRGTQASFQEATAAQEEEGRRSFWVHSLRNDMIIEWKAERKVMIIMIMLFLGCILLPVGVPRFDTAIIEALHLVKWYARGAVIMGLLPSLSVGPEPAIISATGMILLVSGISNVPSIFPVSVFKVIFSSISYPQVNIC